MPYEREVVSCLEAWFERDPQALVNLVAGPKREHWFNAESYVTLSHAGSIDTFVVWGEQEWRTALARTDSGLAAQLSRLKPDLVGYKLGEHTNELGEDIDNIQFVVEAKLIYNSEEESARAKILKILRQQLLNAAQICPDASVMGLLYLVWQGGRGGVPVDFFRTITKQTKVCLSGVSYRWLRKRSALKGLECTISKNGLDCRRTSFRSYLVEPS